MSPRAAAALMVLDVVRDGQSLSRAAPQRLAAIKDARDRSLAQELGYGTLRWLPRLQWVQARRLQRPIKDRDAVLGTLISVGLYQVLHLQIPVHAAVSATVDACEELGKGWGKGLVNAVLRGVVRDRESLMEAMAGEPAAFWAHPPWLLDAFASAWPDAWQDIADAGNQRPPMTIRVNARRCSRQEYLERLEQRGIVARPVPATSHGLQLEAAAEVTVLPGFADGDVSVQDGAAQLAAELLDAGPSHRVLDACAAPGGKTAHVLERCAELAGLVAVERDPQRAVSIASNLRRLGLAAELHTADASRPDTWWDGRPFDRILLDAPCSATGVIRRHPDIKTLRRPEDVESFARTQDVLLDALWPLLARTGKLLYATCSVLPAEGEERIAAFLDRHPDAAAIEPAVTVGRATAHGRQILPGDDDMDGFFYASLTKR